MTARYVVAYWTAAPDPYLVVDTQPETDGTCVVIGGFTAALAGEVADAMNERGLADAQRAELHRQAKELDEARAEIGRLRSLTDEETTDET